MIELINKQAQDIKELKRLNDTLKDDLRKVEAERDDYLNRLTRINKLTQIPSDKDAKPKPIEELVEEHLELLK